MSAKDSNAIDTARSKNIKILIPENNIKMFWTEFPCCNNLCDMWSVPPVVGEILFLILWINTVKKSSRGKVKKRNTGGMEL